MARGNPTNRAMAMALMQSGLGMIANSQVPYGHSVIPGMAGALGYGLNTFGQQMALEREAEQERLQAQAEAARRRAQDLLLQSITGPDAEKHRAAAMLAPEAYAKGVFGSRQPAQQQRLYDIRGPGGEPIKATFDQAVGKQAYVAPRSSGGSRLSKLIAEMNSLPPGDPSMELYRKAIMKDINFAPPMVVQSYGPPTPVLHPDTGETVLAQYGNRGEPPIVSKFRPAPKEVQMKAETMPASVKTKLASKRTALEQIKEARGVLEKNPGAFGPINMLPNIAVQAFDPKGSAPRAALGGATGILRHELMGATASEGERQMYRPFIPDETDLGETLSAKLNELEGLLSSEISNLEAGYRQQPSIEMAPGPGAASPTDDDVAKQYARLLELRRKAGGGR